MVCILEASVAQPGSGRCFLQEDGGCDERLPVVIQKPCTSAPPTPYRTYQKSQYLFILPFLGSAILLGVPCGHWSPKQKLSQERGRDI